MLKTISISFFSRTNSLRRVKNGTKDWKVKDISIDKASDALNSLNINSNRNSANLTGTELSPAVLAQANWTFVEKLLKVIWDFTKHFYFFFLNYFQFLGL